MGQAPNRQPAWPHQRHRLPAVTRLSHTDCIDINTADADALERISHIGPDRAQQVVTLRRQRPFRPVAELTRVNGIGAARSAHIIQRFGPHSRHASRRFPS
jgi:DNA uptake protein ComE-like DNA-binding protein